MSNLCREPRSLIGPFNEKLEEEPTIQPVNTFSVSSESNIQYIVESDEHVVYEVRIHKINHRGDVNLNSLKIADVEIPDSIDFDELNQSSP